MDKPASKGKSFLKQATILAAAGLIVRFFGFLYRPPLTALLGDGGNGIYSAGYQIYNFLLILSSAGLPAAIGRLVSERLALKQYGNAHRVFKVALAFSVSVGTVCMLIMLLGAGFIEEYICRIPGTSYTIISLAPTVLIVAVMATIRGYFQGMNTMVPTAISQIIEQIFNAVFSVFLAWLFISESVALGAAGGTMGTGVGALAGLCVVLLAYKSIKPTLHKRIERVSATEVLDSRSHVLKLIVSTALPIILGTAVYSITNLVDMSMVMARLEVTGLFTEARMTELYGQLQGKYVLLSTLPVAISTSIATAAIPSIAASVALKDKEASDRKITMAIRMSMIISIPAAVGMGVLADQLIYLLFPTAPEGGSLVRIGALSIVFLAMSQIATGMLQGIGDVKSPAINAVFGAIVKIVLNFVLIAIPFLNINGAVIATTGCYIVSSTLNLRKLIKTTHVRLDFKDILLKPAICSAIMGVICFATYKLMYMVYPSNTIVTLVTVLISMAVYGLSMILAKGIRREDCSMLPGGSKLEKLFDILKY